MSSMEVVRCVTSRACKPSVAASTTASSSSAGGCASSQRAPFALAAPTRGVRTGGVHSWPAHPPLSMRLPLLLLFCLQSAVSSLQFSVCSPLSAVFSVQWSVCSLRFLVCSLQCPVCSLAFAVFSHQSSVFSLALAFVLALESRDCSLQSSVLLLLCSCFCS